MKKTILILIFFSILFSPVSGVNAKEGEWQNVMNGWFSGGNSYNAEDHHDNNKKEIEPTAQPVLDLSTDKVFIITPFLISLIVYFVIRKPRFYPCR